MLWIHGKTKIPSNGCGEILVSAARVQYYYNGSNLEFTKSWACRLPSSLGSMTIMIKTQKSQLVGVAW